MTSSGGLDCMATGARYQISIRTPSLLILGKTWQMKHTRC
jgi:hypothetical protein